MKNLALIFTVGILLFASILMSYRADAQTLTSHLSGKTAAGHFIELKYAGPATWKLWDYAPCAKFPCADKDQITETTLSARWVSSRAVVDGNTVIELSNGMIVTFVNNGMAPPKPDWTRAESYWQLEIPSTSGGKPEVVQLLFIPKIE